MSALLLTCNLEGVKQTMEKYKIVSLFHEIFSFSDYTLLNSSLYFVEDITIPPPIFLYNDDISL